MGSCLVCWLCNGFIEIPNGSYLARSKLPKSRSWLLHQGSSCWFRAEDLYSGTWTLRITWTMNLNLKGALVVTTRGPSRFQVSHDPI